MHVDGCHALSKLWRHVPSRSSQAHAMLSILRTVKSRANKLLDIREKIVRIIILWHVRLRDVQAHAHYIRCCVHAMEVYTTSNASAHVDVESVLGRW